MEKFLDNEKAPPLVSLQISEHSGVSPPLNERDAIDIAEQRFFELDSTAVQENVEQPDQIKADFIFNLGRKIRTTFADISSISRLLENQETEPERKYLINAISLSSKELFEYCNALLDFSRIESGYAPIVAKCFNLKELINRILRLEKAALLAQGIKVLEKYSAEVPVLFSGDEYRIERILLNIISNSIKYTHAGQIEISVSLAKIINNEECIIAVEIKDTGIPNDFIFDNFSRFNLANQRKYKREGLTLIKNLITEIKGEIEVESQLERGTTFKCLFTLCYGAAQ